MSWKFFHLEFCPLIRDIDIYISALIHILMYCICFIKQMTVIYTCLAKQITVIYIHLALLISVV
jgi:hypothetical protein